MIQHFPTDSNITLANPMKANISVNHCRRPKRAGENAGNLLLAQGYAVRYNGRDRQDRCGDKALCRMNARTLQSPGMKAG